jgi:putative ABC transport system substrate-binding protein
MKRRAFFAVLAGAAAWALAGHAQQPDPVPRVGVLMPFSENDQGAQEDVTAFAQALGRLGWVGGRNIQIDYRFAANDPALFKNYASELVGLSPNAILASTPPALIALRERTGTIPIVFVLVVDPVGMGLVQSLARPGGNITGFGALDPPMMGKWLQLLKEMAPNVTRRRHLQPGHPALRQIFQQRDRRCCPIFSGHDFARPGARQRRDRESHCCGGT